MMEFVNGKDYPIYEMENNPVMFETTNQTPTSVFVVAFFHMVFQTEHLSFESSYTIHSFENGSILKRFILIWDNP